MQKLLFDNPGLRRDLPIKAADKIHANQKTEFIVLVIIRSSILKADVKLTDMTRANSASADCINFCWVVGFIILSANDV